MLLAGTTSGLVSLDACTVTGTTVSEDEQLAEEAFSDVVFTASSCCRQQ